MVSTRFSFSPPHQLIPIHSGGLPTHSHIVVSITEASFGRAHLGSPRCTTDRHQDADTREVAVAGTRPGRMAARLCDPRDLREGRCRTVPRPTRIATHATVVAEVRR